MSPRKFIYGVLRRWKGTKILKFKIFFRGVYDASLSGDVDFWVGFAMERKVEDLYLHLPYECKPKLLESDPVYLLPQCLYSCSSITKLKLIGYSFQIDCGNGNVQWNRLKSLMLYGYCTSEGLINQLVSSSPQLEVLDVVFTGSSQKLSIRSRSLKMLKLAVGFVSPGENDPSNHSAITVWAPNLEALEIFGTAFSTCLLLNVPSLTRVTLNLNHYRDELVIATLKQVLPAIQHVEALTLSLCCFQMLGVMKAKHSFSSNVKILKSLGGPIEPYDIAGLEFFPKLEKLVIDWKRSFVSDLLTATTHDFGKNYLQSHAKNIKSSFLKQLRTVEVTWRSYETASMFRFIKFLLKHATMVQKVEIKKEGKGEVQSKEMVLAVKELLSLQRSFPTISLTNF